jgi:hypothetical protein
LSLAAVHGGHHGKAVLDELVEARCVNHAGEKRTLLLVGCLYGRRDDGDEVV